MEFKSTKGMGKYPENTKILNNKLFLFFILFIIFLLSYFLVDKFPIHLPRLKNNFVYDETRAISFMVDFWGHLVNRSYHPYYLQKSLCFFIVGGILKCIKQLIDFEINSFLHLSMGIFNIIQILIGSFFLQLTIKKNVNLKNQAILFFLLYGNFVFLIFLQYFSILGDIFAFSLSSAMLYYYLNNKFNQLVVTIMLSQFINPLFFLSSFFLIIFQDEKSSFYKDVANRSKRPSLIYSVLFFLLIMLLFIRGHFIDGGRVIHTVSLWGWSHFFAFSWQVFSLFCLIPLTVFLGSILSIIDIRKIIIYPYSFFIKKRFLLIFSIILLNQIIVNFFSANYDYKVWKYSLNWSFLDALSVVFLYGTSKPFVYVLGNILSFGQIALIFSLQYLDVIRVLKTQKIGFIIFFFVNSFILFSDAESRHLMYFFPWVFYIFVKVIQKNIKPFSFSYLFITNMALMYSWIVFARIDHLKFDHLLMLASMGAGLHVNSYYFLVIEVILLYIMNKKYLYKKISHRMYP